MSGGIYLTQEDGRLVEIPEQSHDAKVWNV